MHHKDLYFVARNLFKSGHATFQTINDLSLLTYSKRFLATVENLFRTCLGFILGNDFDLNNKQLEIAQKSRKKKNQVRRR